MNSIVLWCMDQFPEHFHKINFNTVKLLLDHLDGDEFKTKQHLSEMFGELVTG